MAIVESPRLALMAGKLAMAASRRLGWGGSTWPGRIAAALDPALLERFAPIPRLGSVLVTGTNGKTTTTQALSHIARLQGLRPIHNGSGANLSWGVLSAFIEHAPWTGLPRADVAVLEVDEANLHRVASALRPRVIVVTNFFRDQLDRYGELDTTVRRVAEGIRQAPRGSRVVICADDPMSEWLAEQACSDGHCSVLRFGLEVPTPGGGPFPGAAADGTRCMRCGSPYRYARIYYAQLGHYACPSCGHARRAPDLRVEALEQESGEAVRLRVVTPQGRYDASLAMAGIHNVYNALAATGGAMALGLRAPQIVLALAGMRPPFGRMERLALAGRQLTLILVKNPAGFDGVLRTVAHQGMPGHMVFALNDLAADGRDVSWIWDVRFEQLLAPHAPRLRLAVCSGRRAHDMAVRLKYAGIPPDRLAVQPAIVRAMRLAVEGVAPDQPVPVLATYTAMLQARKGLVAHALPRDSAAG